MRWVGLGVVAVLAYSAGFYMVLALIALDTSEDD